MFFLGILVNPMQNQARSTNQVTHGDQSVDLIDQLTTPGLFQHLKLYFVGYNFEILLKVLYSQPLLKDSLSL